MALSNVADFLMFVMPFVGELWRCLLLGDVSFSAAVGMLIGVKLVRLSIKDMKGERLKVSPRIFLTGVVSLSMIGSV